MKKSARFISISAFIFFSTFLSSMAARAQTGGLVPPPPNGVPTADLPTMINQISSVILLLVGVVAVLFLIIGGFQYMTASGNPDQVQRAKLTIMYSVIGIGVAILSWVIVQFVITALK